MIAPPRPPSHDEVEALIKEARERQLRRRLLGAAGVAVVAALGLAVYALTIGGTAHGGVRGSSPLGGAPACRSSQLAGSSYWNGAAGTVINFFAIENRSSATCSLPLGRPAALLASHGSVLRIEERSASAADGSYGGRPVHDLAPGRKAAVYMDWSNWCGRPKAGLTTTITLLFGHGLRVSARDVAGQPPCLDRTQPSRLTISRPLTPN
jgi:hypothetical protein